MNDINVITEQPRRKYGEIREDGYRFLNYRNRKGVSSEVWVSPISWENRLRMRRDNARKARFENPEKARKIRMDWYYKNVDRERARSMDQWAKNPEEARIRNRRWRGNNPEKVREGMLAWLKENPDRASFLGAKRRAKMLGAWRTLTPNEEREVQRIYSWARKMTRDLGTPHHVDHIIPLRIGGMHVPSNLQVLPAAQNIRKGSRLILVTAFFRALLEPPNSVPLCDPFVPDSATASLLKSLELACCSILRPPDL